MNWFRGAAFALLFVFFIGALGTTGGFAWYLRSDRYRNSCAQGLSSRLQLPCAIGQVVPKSWTAREFEDVLVWLPDRRALAATVDRTRLAHISASADDEYEISLHGGRCEISSRTWLRSDFRFIVESGLKPGFARDGPTRVYFSDFDFTLERPPFRAALTHTSGLVDFSRRTHATVSAACREFNGHASSTPVTLTAEFSPRTGGMQIDDLRLGVPTLSVRTLELARMMGVPLVSGTFSGELHYTESPQQRCVRMSGECRDLQLAELTTGLFPQPWRGHCPRIRLAELVVQNGLPERLSFSGRVHGVRLADLLAPWGLGELDAELELNIRSAVFTLNGIESLIASGYCDGVDLEQLSARLGHGKINGRGTLRIRDLSIVNNQLASFEARLEAGAGGKARDAGKADDAAGPELWISRELLTSAAKQALKISLPPLLPPRVEYAKLGVELKVEDETLYVFGTHGPGDKCILTIRLPGGFELPLVREPEQPIALGAWLETGRATGRAWLGEGVRLWRSRMDLAEQRATSQSVDEHSQERD